MAIGLGAKLARLLLLTFNLIFWLSGIGLVGTGIWLLVDQSKAIVFAIVEVGGTLPMIKIAAYGIIGVGCFVLLVGFLGCCGAMHENRCMLVTYFAVILLILLAELVGGILIVVYKSSLEKSLQDNMQTNLKNNYGMNEPANKTVTDGFDYAQYTFKCCGVRGPGDYNGSAWIQSGSVSALNFQVPLSCCTANGNSHQLVIPENKEQCQALSDTDSVYRYQKGCYEQVNAFIGSANGILIGVGVGIAALELLGMIFAICLCRNIDYDI